MGPVSNISHERPPSTKNKLNFQSSPPRLASGPLSSRPLVSGPHACLLYALYTERFGIELNLPKPSGTNTSILPAQKPSHSALVGHLTTQILIQSMTMTRSCPTLARDGSGRTWYQMAPRPRRMWNGKASWFGLRSDWSELKINKDYTAGGNNNLINKNLPYVKNYCPTFTCETSILCD